MGTYSDFQIEVIKGSVAKNTFRDVFKEVTQYTVDNSLNLWAVKWYDHHADMLEISNRFPSGVFKLSYQCDERGVSEIVYYSGGKFQCANVRVVTTYDEFDESELK